MKQNDRTSLNANKYLLKNCVNCINYEQYAQGVYMHNILQQEK